MQTAGVQLDLEMPLDLRTKLFRNPDILHAAVGKEEAVMMSIEAGRYFGVNAVGARIWELLETPQSVEQLCARLCAEFEVDAQTCEAGVVEFTRNLIDNGIVHESAA